MSRFLRHSASATLGLLLFLSLSCADSQPVLGPEGPEPLARASRSFGDAPVSGEVLLLPPSDLSAWHYTVDLNGDGIPEAESELKTERSISYSFNQVGIHRIVVTFRLGSRVRADTLHVIVNDPEAVVIQRAVIVDDTTLWSLTYFDGFLYTTHGGTVYRRDPSTFQVLSAVTIPDPFTKKIVSVAVSPEGRLYAGNIRRTEVLEFETPTLLHSRSIPTPTDVINPIYLDAHIAGRLYLGGRGSGVNLFDTAENRVVAQRIFPNDGHFAVAPSARWVAIVEHDGVPSVRLLDGSSLEQVVEVPIVEMRPEVVGFSAEEDVLYVLGLDGNSAVRFLAVEVTSARIIRDLVLEPCPEWCFSFQEANSIASTSAFTAVTTWNGTYLIDHEVHLPRYRVGATETLRTCCNVAWGPDGRTLFFAGQLGFFGSAILSPPAGSN